MERNSVERAALARYAAQALKSAAGEALVARGIFKWLVEQEDALLLQLPCALVASARRLQEEHSADSEGEVSFWAACDRHRGDVLAALERAAKIEEHQKDALAANLRMLGDRLCLTGIELGILEVAARYPRCSRFESFCDSLHGNAVEALAGLLGVSRGAVRSATHRGSDLARSGVLRLNPASRFVSGYDGYVEIPQWLDDQLDRPFDCFEAFRDAILGASRAPDLAWQDFAHIAERDLIARTLRGAVERHGAGLNILLYGPSGCAKTALCNVVAARLGLALVSIGEVEERALQGPSNPRLARLALAQRLLRGCAGSVLLFDDLEDLLESADESETARKAFFNRILESNPVPVLWTCEDVRWIDPAFIRRMTLVVEMKLPEPRARARMWVRMLRRSPVEISPQDLEHLAEQAEVAPGLAVNALRAAGLARGGAPEVYQAIQGHAKALNHGGPLPLTAEDTEAFVPSLASADHDLDALTADLAQSGAGAFSLCLSGPSGTGKSAYARHLSRALGLCSFRKRASDLLGMYVGETEKRIARAFEEARERNAFLIFDEADSLLGDRREAFRSWEVSQVNEMLTWMESHPLPFCCTTNLVDRLDPASLRRFTFNVAFDYLDRRGVERACAHYFGAALSARPELAARLADLPNLTPGDFAAVRRKAAILGVLDDGAELARLLVAASEVKPGRSVPVGFLR